ncbi:hypothetical protein NNC19_13310 [Clostridium sp. SHJSY1]|uniref:hypothetical protein n=1 Tax=Clostridium sp. SHJSY1 TaxID=2942483 RepID=UPI002874F6D0|nr:hypothetical protein [Clostridium sp. SHJSY1]MDS0526664.1 hypothetical protein [Clostridium sp. SHJSY1]
MRKLMIKRILILATALFTITGISLMSASGKSLINSTAKNEKVAIENTKVENFKEENKDNKPTNDRPNGEIKNISSEEKQRSEALEKNTFVKRIQINSVGPIKYLSILFQEGSIEDYSYEFDGKDITTTFTKVSTEGNVIKHELKDGEKKLVIKQKSTGKSVLYEIK